jgi:hypothetical protein
MGEITDYIGAVAGPLEADDYVLAIKSGQLTAIKVRDIEGPIDALTISSGAMDDAPIGGSTPAAIAGTTGDFSGVLTPTGGIAVDSFTDVSSFSNSWVNYGGVTDDAGYMKDPMGFVHLRGCIKDGTVGSTAFTLPSGYRPTATKYFSIFATSAFGVLRIQADGTVAPLTPTDHTLVSLDGIIFKAA